MVQRAVRSETERARWRRELGWRPTLLSPRSSSSRSPPRGRPTARSQCRRLRRLQRRSAWSGQGRNCLADQGWLRPGR